MASVTIVTDIGETFTLPVAPNYKVSSLKTDLVEKARCSTESMVLTYSGQILKDDDTVQGFNIRDGERILLYVRMPAEYEVFVCPPTGELVRIPLTSGATTEDLWEKVRDLIEVGPSMQLLYQGNPLPSGQCLVELQLGPCPQFRLWPTPPI